MVRLDDICDLFEPQSDQGVLHVSVHAGEQGDDIVSVLTQEDHDRYGVHRRLDGCD